MSDYITFKIDPDKENIDRFVEYVKDKYPFSDTYHPKLPISIKPHYHVGHEARLFVEGTAYFVLDNETIVCEPGTYIEIKPKVPHSFYSTGEFKAIRFNQEYENWTAVDIV